MQRADEQPGTVFIGEEFDAEEPYVLTGRFSAHWEASHGRGYRDGPTDVPVEEAIEWGRSQAEVVLVRLGDSDIHYSAGNRQPPPVEDDDEDFPGWPEGKQVARRRWPGMEHLDLVADEPIPWQVRLPRRVSIRDAEGESERLREAVAREADASDVRCDLDRHADRTDAVLHFAVLARSHEEAMQMVFDLETRASEQVPYPVDELAGDGGWVVDPVGWDPMDGIRPLSHGDKRR